MAKRREERFQSARDFSAALKEAVKPRPASAEDNRSMPTITDTVPLRKWIVIFGSPMVVVGVIAFLMTNGSLRVDPAPSAGQTEPRAATVSRPSPGTVFRDRLKDGTHGPAMVVVPAGRFLMGSAESNKDTDDDERPPHEVTIPKPFAMGRFEVTFEEYDRFAKATGRPLPEDEGWGRGRQPVINVSFDDARAYAEWLSKETDKSYRLPSEAEWEYAARAGTETAYWWGRDVGKNQANCNSCGSRWDDQQTAPVGSFDPNPYGLYDTTGNVWEWVEDCDHSTYTGAPADGRAWVDDKSCGSRVVRGGSWFNNPWRVRSAIRDRYRPANRNNVVGFRLARTF